METKSKKLDFNNQSFFLGIDVHKKSWKVTIRSNRMELCTFSMNPSPEELVKHMQKHYPKGKYFSVYEAGFSGYWIDRKLRAHGIENIVVSPADIPTRSKERTTKSDTIILQVKISVGWQSGKTEEPDQRIPDVFRDTNTRKL
jgi:hypothetical protein